MSQEPDQRQAIEAALLTKKDTAALLGIGVSTLERYCACQWVPRGIRIGNLLRWRRADVLAWVEAGCPRPDSTAR